LIGDLNGFGDCGRVLLGLGIFGGDWFWIIYGECNFRVLGVYWIIKVDEMVCFSYVFI
jgi:hypothetical protein